MVRILDGCLTPTGTIWLFFRAIYVRSTVIPPMTDLQREEKKSYYSSKHAMWHKAMYFNLTDDSQNFDSVEEIPARFASDVDLYCRLSGQGPMRWERPDWRPLNRANQFPNGRLRIQNVQPQDAGVYLCVRGDQTQYVRLKVETGIRLTKECGSFKT